MEFPGGFQFHPFALAINGGLIDAENPGSFGDAAHAFQDFADVVFLHFLQGNEFAGLGRGFHVADACGAGAVQREVFRPDPAFPAQDHGPLDGVAQFAQV